LELSYSGLVFVEDKLLSPFNDKIFLVAACDEMIYKLIDEVYKPAVNQLGYELIFQERSEPKGTIHDDIWEYLEHSKLILCDLTLQRPNCFIEYGYALAKGKHIILCVEESEGKTNDGKMTVPFDTLTQKYSFWRKDWLTTETYREKIAEFRNEIQERIKMKLSILDAELRI
jgi:nucleoside 2-deoxyribosyltransferase